MPNGQEIKALLEQIPTEISRRGQRAEALKAELEKHRDSIVIYGHGSLGTEVRQNLECAGWKVRAFIDANQRTDLENHVLNLQDADRHLEPDVLIIVALWNILAEYESVQNSLRDRGFHNILSFLDLRVWPELFQGGHVHSVVSWELADIPEAQVLDAYDILEDELSRKVFLEQLHFKIDSPYGKLTLYPSEEQYMPFNVYSQVQDECIVDCGAYNGDTMRAFLKKLGGWKSYVAVEPDPQNFAQLERYIETELPAHLRPGTKALRAAVSNEAGSLAFASNGNSASHIAAQEAPAEQVISVPVVRLDDVIQEPVSLIKMDVEEFELRALEGAEGLIQRNQPLLTICGYHRQSDLWEIPLYMKKLLPHHHIFLRNYVGIIEYVFYAVPESRMILQ